MLTDRLQYSCISEEQKYQEKEFVDVWVEMQEICEFCSLLSFLIYLRHFFISDFIHFSQDVANSVWSRKHDLIVSI